MNILSIVLVFFVLSCSSQNSEVTSYRDDSQATQATNNEVQVDADAQAQNPNTTQNTSNTKPSLLNLVENLETAASKEETKKALQELAAGISEADINQVDPLLLTRVQNLTDTLKDKFGDSAAENAEKISIGDLIGEIKVVISQIIDHVVNTAMVGGMGCGLVKIDADNPPADDSEECKVAKCVYEKCQKPGYKIILCSDDNAWPFGKPGICKVAGNQMCGGIPTGMCVPDFKTIGDDMKGEVDGHEDEKADDKDNENTPIP